MEIPKQYSEYKKPAWAPPTWLFGPVWTLLYVLIAISFGYVVYRWIAGNIPTHIVIPFVLNVIFNLLFTPIQFRLRNAMLASLDIFFVLLTLVWAMVTILPIAAWVAYVNIPYLAWVAFATVLQFTIAAMNAKE